MLEKNNTSFQLLTVTLACLSGVLVKTPAATAVPDEEAPTTLEQLNTVNVDATEVATVSPKLDLVAMPTVENFEVAPLRTSSAELPTIKQPTEVNVDSTPSTAVIPTLDLAARPTVENFEVAPLRTSVLKLPTMEQPAEINVNSPSATVVVATPDSTAITKELEITPLGTSTAKLPTIEPLTDVNVDSTPSTAVLPSPEPVAITTVKDFEAAQLGTSADELLTAEQPIRVTPELFASDAAQPVLAQTEGEAESAEAETDATARNDGFYIRLGAGFQNRADAQDFIGRASFDTGYKLNGAVGYRYSDFRAEVEYTYFRNDFDELTFFEPGTTTPVAGPPETSPGAYVDGRALMLNVYYDIPLSRRLRPYIGGGIGVYNAHIVELSPPGFGGFEANGFSASRFAFQLRAGLSYAITDSLDISLGYRYFQGNRFEYDIADSPLELEPNGLETNGAELSLTYTF